MVLLPAPNATVGTAALTLRTMGTVVSIRLGRTDAASAARAADDALRQAALTAVTAVFAGWDARFSLYRADSELSRIGRGELRLTRASQELRDCYAIALDWRERTDGAFSPHRADGVLDLSGVVKALAIDEAGDTLTGTGLIDWSVNAGGDILAAGNQAPGRDWVAAIVDPFDRGRVLSSCPLVRPVRAVATSGSAERGEHIWSHGPGTASTYRQVSVFAQNIVTADVLATAIIAGGESALQHSTQAFPIEVLAVLQGGSLVATPGLRAPRD